MTKEIHKILEKKIDLALKPLGYKKNGPLKWYLPVQGLSRAIEIQRSQWSDVVYINIYIYVGDEKPKRSTPYLTTRLGGIDLNMEDEVFNKTLDLAEGDIYEKTNLIPEYIIDGLKNTLDKIHTVEDARGWLEKKSFDVTEDKYRFAHTSGKNVYEALGVSSE